MIEGISHITFIVRDLEKSAAFLRDVFDAKEVYSSGKDIFSLSPEKFLLINNTWIALMQGEAINKSYNHIAFKISEDQFDDYLMRVQKFGVEIKTPRYRVEGEGQSVYFYDYDNHLFELHTGTLEQRITHYAKHKETISQ